MSSLGEDTSTCSDVRLRMESFVKKSSYDTTNTKLSENQLKTQDRIRRLTKRIVAPYAEIKWLIDRKKSDLSYFDSFNFNLQRVQGLIPIKRLLFETTMVLKAATQSSGAFLYLVNKEKTELIMKTSNKASHLKRHEVNLRIEEGRCMATHAAAARRWLRSRDARRDRRWAEGVRWAAAQAALAVPVLTPAADCYAVLQLYNTDDRVYSDHHLYTLASIAQWAGAAAHMSARRKTLARCNHLKVQLLDMTRKLLCDNPELDDVITDLLTIMKSYMAVAAATFHLLQRRGLDEAGAVWREGPGRRRHVRKKMYSIPERTPLSLVIESGALLNVPDAYYDPRLDRELDPATGSVTRGVLAGPVLVGGGRVSGVISVMNKETGLPFYEADEEVFKVFLNNCTLILGYYSGRQREAFVANRNIVCLELMSLHLHGCAHDFARLMAGLDDVTPPDNFLSIQYYIDAECDDLLGLVCYMLSDVLGDSVPKDALVDVVLTTFRSYRSNPYHNKLLAFHVTHAMYVALKTNPDVFHVEEMLALMFVGLFLVADHPAYFRHYMRKVRDPLAMLFETHSLQRHHYLLAVKTMEEKKLLSRFSPEAQGRIRHELNFAMLSLDNYLDFQIRGKIEKIINDRKFSWRISEHRYFAKSVLIRSCNKVIWCKPFEPLKSATKALFKELYFQGDRERELGYTPSRSYDRRREAAQPEILVEYFSVAVLPCFRILSSVLPNTGAWELACRASIESFRDEIATRGLRVWSQAASLPGRGASADAAAARDAVLQATTPSEAFNICYQRDY